MKKDRKKDVYLMLKDFLPLDEEVESNTYFSVYPCDKEMYACHLRNDDEKTAGVLRIKKQRLDTMTYEEFCNMLSIMKERTMKSLDLLCER